MPRVARKPHRIGPLTNISRQAGAWNVVVIRRGERYSDYFPDGVWGGRDEALVAAQRFRDGLLLQLDADTRVRRVATHTARRTGVVGVSLERHVVGGRRYTRYVAHWVDEDGITRRRRFLVERYGRKEARALAVEARQDGVARAHAEQQARQRSEARRRLRAAPSMPRQVKDPLSRKGISMARRRPRAG